MLRPNILLVDDDKDYLLITKEFLEDKGFAIETSTNPDEAINKLRNDTFSAVIIDLRLYDVGENDFSGLDLANRISQFRTLPILLITQHPSYQAAFKALSSHFRKKPLVVNIVLKQDGLGSLLSSLEDVLIPKRVFLSYAREDVVKVKKLYAKLEKAGLDPWMDIFDIQKGTKWEIAIERAISEADFFVICVSINSEDKRGYFRLEVNKAIDLCLRKLNDDVFLIPLRLDKTDVKSDTLKRFQWINYYEPLGLQQLLEALREGGRKYLYPN